MEEEDDEDDEYDDDEDEELWKNWSDCNAVESKVYIIVPKNFWIRVNIDRW